MPNDSGYSGYCFWHPSKLVRNGRNSYSASVSYTEDFKFRLLKYGNGNYNRFKVISEKEVSYLEIEEAFKTTDENIFGKGFKR